MARCCRRTLFPGLPVMHTRRSVLNGTESFIGFVSTFHKKDSISGGGAAIGVAVSDRPTGPFVDAIGKALTINEMTTDMKYGWDDIDPTVFIDDDGQAYLFWGNGSCKWVKLKKKYD
jgi:hypothetical protein